MILREQTILAGTTTATVLTRAILSEGTKSVAAGMNPMDLRRGINVAVQAVVADLKLRATNISTTEEIAQVRTPLNCAIALTTTSSLFIAQLLAAFTSQLASYAANLNW